jgi:hypothetical protein
VGELGLLRVPLLSVRTGCVARLRPKGLESDEGGRVSPLSAEAPSPTLLGYAPALVVKTRWAPAPTFVLAAHHRFAEKLYVPKTSLQTAASRKVLAWLRHIAWRHRIGTSAWHKTCCRRSETRKEPPVINRKHNRAPRVIDDWRVGHSGAYVALQLGDGEPVLLALAEARKLGGALVVEASNHRESVGLIARQEESKTDGSSRARTRGAQGPEEYVASKMHAAGRRAPS